MAKAPKKCQLSAMQRARQRHKRPKTTQILATMQLLPFDNLL
jgi:hypothetical protein